MPEDHEKAPTPSHIAAAFIAAARRDPTRPMLTWYDDASGDRTELSGATLENWVSKTANMLVDGLGLGSGDRAGVLLPPHWQTAAVLLGCAAAGVEVTTDPAEPVDVGFALAGRIGEADAWPSGDRYALSLAPLAMPMREVPPGWQDYVLAVRVFGDSFAAYPRPVTQSSPAQRFGLAATDRVLIDSAVYPDPRDWLLAPVFAGASLVLCAHLNRDKLPERVIAEQVTRDLT